MIDTIMMLSGERTGHMSKYAFTASSHMSGSLMNGPALWRRFEREVGENYPYKREQRHIRALAPDIFSCLPDRPVSLIEIGPGSLNALQRKTNMLIHRFNEAAQYHHRRPCVAEYKAFDISASFAQDAADYIGHSNDIPAEAITGDLTIRKLKIPAGGTPLAIMFGGTLFNAPAIRGLDFRHVVGRHLRNIAEMTGPGGYILISHDIRLKKQTLRAYEHETCRQACLSILYRMAADLPIKGLMPENFGYAVTWNKHEHLMTMNAVYESPKPAVISLGGCCRLFEQGDMLPLVNAYKFPVPVFQGIARDTGLAVHHTFVPKGDNMAFHLLRTP